MKKLEEERNMRKVVPIFIAITVLICVLKGPLGKSDEMMIENRMKEFLNAYNSGDLEGTLACLDAKTRNTYRAALKIGNGLIGLTGYSIDVADMFSLGIGLMADGDVLKFDEMVISITSDTKATVSGTVQYCEQGTKYRKTVSFELVKEEKDWYICG